MEIKHDTKMFNRPGKRVKPYTITRFLQLNGERIQIAPISTEMTGLNVTTIYAQKQIVAKDKRKEGFNSVKSKRILEALQASGTPLNGAELSRIGSGKENGWCASLSKEISRLRAQGHNVVKVIDHWIEGQRQTAYQLNPPSIE